MKRILLFAASALVLFACSKEDEAPKTDLQKKDINKQIFYATTEGTNALNTKVYADEDLNLLWNENDLISIFNKTTQNSKYCFTGYDGDNSGGFELVSESEIEFETIYDIPNIYAIYPYSTKNKVNSQGDQIVLTIPATQTYRAGSFGSGANAMIAIADGYFLPFKNVCGYLKLKLYGENVTVNSVSIQGNNGEKLAGKAYVTLSEDGIPTVSMDDAASNKITINCPEPVTLGGSSTDFTEFYFVIPPIDITEGFKVDISFPHAVSSSKSTSKSLTISRNRLESMKAFEVIPNVLFEDDIFKAFCVENFDENNDGEISYKEAKQVSKIEVNTTNILSLGGIECFTNLTVLKCGGTDTLSNRGKLTFLDLSHNTLLDTINCNYNQLESLDVSNCTSLRDLHCGYNELTSLNLQDNTSLTWLWCNYNKITSLDLSNNLALNSLTCPYNNLTSLDLSNNTELTGIRCQYNKLTDLNLNNVKKLEVIFCHNNLLTSLDLSDNLNLHHAACQDNQLTYLNVDNCDLSWIKKGLYCYNNKLTSLDLSKCPNLNSIRCYNNLLTELDLSHQAIHICHAAPQAEVITIYLSRSKQEEGGYILSISGDESLYNLVILD